MRDLSVAVAAGNALGERVMALDKVKRGQDKTVVAASLTRLLTEFCTTSGIDLSVSATFCDVHALMNKTWHTELACVNLDRHQCDLFFHDRLLTFDDPNSGLAFVGKCWVLLLVIECARSMGSELKGRFVFEIGDNGGLDSVAFCSRAEKPCLILDPEFALSAGYSDFRRMIQQDAPAWELRRNQVFWRGSTTGRRLKTAPAKGQKDDLSWLQRLQLCIAARDPSIAALCDIGVVNIVQIPEDYLVDNIVAAKVIRNKVDRAAFLDHKFVVDIDGNSNSWSGLFCTLLGGSCVLKVASVEGYRQWYYDKLVPWQNFVPVKAELSDLPSSVLWATGHKELSAEIAARGRELAMAITLQQALEASARRLSRWLEERLLKNPELPYLPQA